jgi:hypothetical protein
LRTARAAASAAIPAKEIATAGFFTKPIRGFGLVGESARIGPHSQ